VTKPLNVLFVDNFDSFTFNLVDELAKRHCGVDVWRNDQTASRLLEIALAMPAPRLIVLSPGPGVPASAGACIDLVKLALGKVPLFGVCLGHQAIIEALGGTVGSAGEIVHGKADLIEHDGTGIFSTLPSPMTVGRYHSLAGFQIPQELRVTARCRDIVMAVQHRDHMTAGVQFHPESILTPLGGRLIENLMTWACEPTPAEVA